MNRVELLFVAKWLSEASVTEVCFRMGVTRAWIDRRVRAIAAKSPPELRETGTAKGLKTLATAFVESNENKPERPGVILPDGACDPARWRDALRVRMEGVAPPPCTPDRQNVVVPFKLVKKP